MSMCMLLLCSLFVGGNVKNSTRVPKILNPNISHEHVTQICEIFKKKKLSKKSANSTLKMTHY